MYTLHDVLDAYDTAQSLLVREALRRWIYQMLYDNHRGLAHDDAADLFRAETLFWRTTNDITRIMTPMGAGS